MIDTSMIVLSGRLTRDPEMKTTKTGKTVCNFSLACNDFGDNVSFFECQAWEKTSEIIEKYCKKGNKVLIVGRPTQQRWDDPETGKARSKIIVNVNTIEFTGGKKQEDVPDGPGVIPSSGVPDGGVPAGEIPF